jgi:hypothetical protein
MQMADKNAKLAKENNLLKASLTRSGADHEELLKKAIKTQYFRNLSHKQMIECLDENISAIRSCLECCNHIKDAMVQNFNILKEKNKAGVPLDISKGTDRYKMEYDTCDYKGNVASDLSPKQNSVGDLLFRSLSPKNALESEKDLGSGSSNEKTKHVETQNTKMLNGQDLKKKEKMLQKRNKRVKK